MLFAHEEQTNINNSFYVFENTHVFLTHTKSRDMFVRLSILPCSVQIVSSIFYSSPWESSDSARIESNLFQKFSKINYF